MDQLDYEAQALLGECPVCAVQKETKSKKMIETEGKKL